jgi:hypothetical protein
MDLSSKILENLSEGSEENSFLIEQDQSSDHDSFPDPILSMFQKLNQISDIDEIQNLLGQIQKSLDDEAECLNETQLVANSQHIQFEQEKDSEIKPKIDGIFQLRDLMKK